MWKKIHTIYSIIATLLSASMFFFSFATIIGPEGAELKIMYYEKLPYLFMLIMLLAAGVCSVFTYRNGFLQARVCILTALMLIGFQIWLGVDFFMWRKELIFSVTMLFPLAAAALEIIAARRAVIDGLVIQAVRQSKRK